MAWKLVQAFFNFQKILCKKDSVNVSKLIWTDFERFAITYVIQVAASKISFANGSYASLFANTKGPGTSFQAAVFAKNFDEFFSFLT